MRRDASSSSRLRARGGARRRGCCPPVSSSRAGAARRSGARLGAEKALGSYLDARGRPRAVVRREGAGGSLLVIDEDRRTRGDRRLLAHLSVDEPIANAELVCALYLDDRRMALDGRRRALCRRLNAEDARVAACTELEGQASARTSDEASAASSDGASAAGGGDASAAAQAGPAGEGRLRDAEGNVYGLARVMARIAIPELRWCRKSATAAGQREPLSVRELVGALERYEPVRALSAEAIARHRRDPRVSVSTLASELERMNASRIVLNRGLREAVLAALAGSELSMSEIALRCGRVKRDRRGVVSGETTWLSRRIGLVRERGAAAPTPWVHSDVLGLIARRGLGIAPREVELG
jgi:AraC-like DNA-binding protein